MGCLDIEVAELGLNGGQSQSCLLGNWSKTGQPACPILCKYYNGTGSGAHSHTDDIGGNRIVDRIGDRGTDNHNPDTAVPLYYSTGTNCSGHVDCGQDIQKAPFDPFMLSTAYHDRATAIFNLYGKSIPNYVI